MKPLTVSLESKLTERHTQDIESAEEIIDNAQYQLGRLSLIYGGQLQFDFHDTFDPEAA